MHFPDDLKQLENPVFIDNMPNYGQSREKPDKHPMCYGLCVCAHFISGFSRIRFALIPILLGQVLAGLIAVTAICSTFLANSGISLPLTQNLLHYIVLSVCYICVRLVRQRCYATQTQSTVQTDVYKRSRLFRVFLYVLAGLIDAHANWSIVAAYRFTTVTSIQLLDCLAIPAAMLFSFLFLRHRFLWTHYVATVVCLIGAGGMVAADVLANPSPTPVFPNASLTNSTSPQAPNVILGDILVILGSIAYAASNVLQQYLVVCFGILDFLIYAGISAVVPTAVYTVIFERDDVSHLFSPSSELNYLLIIGCLVGYVLAMFLLYSLMPYVLAKTSAVLVNLSLLTADVYALLLGIYLFHYKFHILYVLCFVVILFGVGLYTSRTPTVHTQHLNCLIWITRRLHLSESPLPSSSSHEEVSPHSVQVCKMFSAETVVS
ncbi:hypothetical protein P879_02199 [Paragonimus westermani]|uniref:Solute carrier family 35, member F1/2 n=1 Tax=Paragonimus westermani TaxID=34504 RepID=A0A8T0DVM1_9TREM|nr:hypothetical protein P879_02199 [Paragonimus westermani]